MVRALWFGGLIVAALLSIPCVPLAAHDSAISSHDNDMAQIYAAFLNTWTGNPRAPLNISKSADLPTPDDIKQYTECAREDGNKLIRWVNASREKDVSGILTSVPNANWIDPKNWQPKDPGALIAKGQSVDSAVDAGISHGLMTLSAITFNQQHDLALFTYSFRCGALCGNGGTVMFKKTSSGWVRSKANCGGWES